MTQTAKVPPRSLVAYRTARALLRAAQAEPGNKLIKIGGALLDGVSARAEAREGNPAAEFNEMVDSQKAAGKGKPDLGFTETQADPSARQWGLQARLDCTTGVKTPAELVEYVAGRKALERKLKTEGSLDPDLAAYLTECRAYEAASAQRQPLSPTEGAVLHAMKAQPDEPDLWDMVEKNFNGKLDARGVKVLNDKLPLRPLPKSHPDHLSRAQAIVDAEVAAKKAAAQKEAAELLALAQSYQEAQAPEPDAPGQADRAKDDQLFVDEQIRIGQQKAMFPNG